MKILKNFQNFKIRNKIRVVFIPIVLLPIIIIAIFSNIIFANSIRNMSNTNVENDSKLIVTKTNSVLDSANNFMQVVAMNIINIYQSDNGDIRGLNNISLNNSILGTMNYYTNLFHEIDYAAFIDVNANVVTTSNTVTMNPGNFTNTKVVQSLFQLQNTRNTWYPLDERDYLVKNSDVPVFSIGKKIVAIDSGKTLGYLIANIREDTFASVFPEAAGGRAEIYQIADSDGLVVVSNNQEQLLQKINGWNPPDNAKNVDIDGKRFLMSYEEIPQMNWTLIVQVPYSELVHEIYINTVMVVIVSIICICLTLSCTLLLSKTIVNPIVRLTNLARKIKLGNLNVTFYESSSDEVGVLSSAFGTMLDRFQQLLEEVREEQKEKRKFELDLLQSQIQPHFLYNTMETINMLIRLDLKETALSTSNSLVEFYRILLSKGNTIIKIRDELQLSESYLSIQSVRYTDYMDYSIDVAEDILDFDIPKLTLQPLIENAIYHGLKHREDKGHLAITGYWEDDFIVIQVWDNGVGMTQKQIDCALSVDLDQASRTSFGLSNVNSRIKMIYGDHSGLKIESEPGLFTKVSVLLERNGEGKP